MSDPTTCQRHPSVETRLRCAACEDPICPRCAVEAPVGMRCPSCARPDRATAQRRRPDQIGRGAAVAVVGALFGGGLIGAVRLLLPIGALIAAYFVGLQIGRRVREAASGNTVDVVRGVAVAGALGAAAVAEVVLAVGRGGIVELGFYSALRAGIAAYAAWSATS